MALLLEVIVQSVADARAAAQGGADRLEVVRAIRDGGLTPPVSLVRAIAAEVPLPLRVMVRGNAGYSTDAHELPVLCEAAAAFAAARVDGIVVGFADGCDPAIPDTVRVLEAAPGTRATFHRAFDQLHDPLHAIDLLSAVPQIDRILTSGGAGTPAERCARLRKFTTRARGRIAIIAGSAVDEEMLALIAQTQCAGEVHVGRAARASGDPEAPVSAGRVTRLRELAG
jgi:copper homeostasis protein